MWKTSGYIMYKGEYPISAMYLVHDTIDKEFLWTSDSNDATVFPTMEYAKLVYPDFNDKDYKFRLVVITDEPVV